MVFVEVMLVIEVEAVVVKATLCTRSWEVIIDEVGVLTRSIKIPSIDLVISFERQ